MRRTLISILPVLGLFLLILLSLYLMGHASQDSDRFGQLYFWLLLFNLFLLLLLTVAIMARLAGVVRDLWTRKEGARLTWRLVVMFVVVAMIPVLMVFLFSVRFLSTGIDRWFDVQIEESLQSALDLSRLSLDYRMRVHLKDVENTVESLRKETDIMVGVALNQARKDIGADDLTLLAGNNRIIATSNTEHTLVVPKFPAEDIMFQLGRGENYVGLEAAPEGGLQIRAIAKAEKAITLEENYLLVALFPVPEAISDLADEVQAAFNSYKSKEFLRTPLQQSFGFTLLLVLFLGILFAVWAAFFMARKLLSPIIDLASATRAVSEGDYQQRIAVSNDDELGFLVRSFNAMTVGIQQAREAAEESQQLVENQREYLDTVLSNLSTGVLTLDNELRVRTANDAVSEILEMGRPLKQFAGEHIADIARSHPVMESFTDQLVDVLSKSVPEWSRQIVVFGDHGRKDVICQGMRLPLGGSDVGGLVIVFDDVTDLIKAQRDAAWGEVARRLAHEIKNPLTPIQLSAERIERRITSQLPQNHAEMLQRATQTIIRQVESMKDMVNAFRDYANTPQAKSEPVDLNALALEVIELYQDNPNQVQVKTWLSDDLPILQADGGRIRQVLHNLIKNAMEALGDKGGTITISTALANLGHSQYIELTVSDDGEGIPVEMLEKLFEPYATSKHKGTGLGLAIVKKIVEEYGGVVSASNLPDGGAQFSVRLPENG